MYDNRSLTVMNDFGNDTMYLSDINTYELLYLSPQARRAVNMTTEEEYQGTPCYKVLYGLDAPCPFCTNHLLTETDFYTWEYENTALGRRYALRDRLVHYQGRLVRMEIASDITDQGYDRQRKSVDEAILNCIHQLNNCDRPEISIHAFLAQIGTFYQADNVHICETNPEKGAFESTYGWSSPELQPSSAQQTFSFPSIKDTMEIFHNTGFLCLDISDGDFDHHSVDFMALRHQGVKKLIAVPLLDRLGTVIGLLGVHNPKENADDPRLLQLLSHFVVDGIEKNTILRRLDNLTYHDSLTGLHNRNRYVERIQELREVLPSCLGVVCMDIDRLKDINDVYGHSYGDRVLIRTANVLAKVCTDDTYRVSGDQFVAFFPDISKEEFQYFVERLRNMVNAEENLHVSMGTKWALGAVDIMEQITDAKNLMAMDKQSHYLSAHADQDAYSAKLRQKLTAEIKNGEFTVLLQPKINLKTGQVSGAEALVRKLGPCGEVISPAIFIPLYEKEGIVQIVDYYVLETVCKTMEGWTAANIAFPPVSVNFSRITITDENFVENICKICRRYEIAPKMIDVEITERVSEIDLQVLTALVKRLRNLGFHVSLDDFGMEYSNLITLASIDFDTIKIDKSMVDHVVSNRKARVIVEHVIQIGKALDQTELVAEGIETVEQFQVLKQLDCDVGQGYYFSKPLSIPEFCDRYLYPKD